MAPAQPPDLLPALKDESSSVNKQNRATGTPKHGGTVAGRGKEEEEKERI